MPLEFNEIRYFRFIVARPKLFILKYDAVDYKAKVGQIFETTQSMAQFIDQYYRKKGIVPVYKDTDINKAIDEGLENWKEYVMLDISILETENDKRTEQSLKPIGMTKEQKTLIDIIKVYDGYVKAKFSGIKLLKAICKDIGVEYDKTIDKPEKTNKEEVQEETEIMAEV